MEYTLLEAARELGFTKNAVKYRAQKLPPDVIRRSEDGIIYITSSGIELLRDQMGKKAQPVQETTSTMQELDNNQQTTGKEPVEIGCSTTKEPIEKPPSTTENAALLAAIDALTAQLATKDEQIASQARQIETLVESLKLAQQTVAAAQALHAGTIQKELSSAQPESEVPEEPVHQAVVPQKISLWKRIKIFFE